MKIRVKDLRRLVRESMEEAELDELVRVNPDDHLNPSGDPQADRNKIAQGIRQTKRKSAATNMYGKLNKNSDPMVATQGMQKIARAAGASKVSNRYADKFASKVSNESELTEADLDEDSFDQAKSGGPVKSFVANMNSAREALGKAGAQKALADLYQSNSDKAAGAQVEKLLDAVKKIDNSIGTVVQWLEKMPEVTKDPWHQVRKRD